MAKKPPDGCAQECSSFQAGKHKRFGRSLVAGAHRAAVRPPREDCLDQRPTFERAQRGVYKSSRTFAPKFFFSLLVK